MEPKTEKIALFIDGANLYATAKSLGFDVDYKRLLREFHARISLARLLLHRCDGGPGVFVDHAKRDPGSCAAGQALYRRGEGALGTPLPPLRFRP
jgi:hypothetical protein